MTRALLWTSLLVSSLLFAPAPSMAAETREVVTVKDADYFGFDLRTVQDVSLDECKQVCIDDGECKAFTYNTKAQWCFLKSDFKKMNAFPGAVAGKIVVTQTQAESEPDIGAAPKMPFITTQQENDAARQKEQLATADGQSGLSVEALLVIARQDATNGVYPHAMATFKSALVQDPGNIDLWLEMAGIAGRSNQDWSVNADGLSASVNAYQLSRTRTQRAQALAALAKAYENNQLYRDGINALKASLALVEDPAVKLALNDYIERYGFRVTGNTIDADSADPRACVQFSEPLVKAGADYTSFVTLNGAAPKSVDAKGSEICVGDLKHGERYKLALRQGLPSSVDEALRQQVDLDIYVRDRAPTVRFTGDSFVLPSTARRGIPIVSINTDSAQLKLYRIGDRNIASILYNSAFLTQVDGYRASQIESDQGQLVWSGDIVIAPELNKEVVTSFPVDEAIPERKPGVYVLTATASQAQTNDWDSKATQWFVVSDTGLTTYAGTDGLHVFARSLASAKPLAGVTLNLLARNNEVLGTATTDAQGQAVFSAGLMRGSAAMAPAILTAQNGAGDYVFLDMTRAGFDLSDRGVTGRTAPGAVDVLTWTERGIYRAGETVHLASLARDIEGKAIEKLPLTFIVTRPDGVEDRRLVETGGALGGYAVDLPMLETAMRGAWTVRVHTDPNQPSIREQTFLVEDFTPDRIEFDMTTADKAIEPGKPVTIDIDGRYLYGAPSAGLELEGEISLKPTRTSEAFPKYQFGLADEEAIEESRNSLEGLPVLDEQGKAAIPVDLPALPSTTQFLEAKISIRMREAGGRAVERNLTLPVKTGDEAIGVKPEFDGEVPENSLAKFHVISLDRDGQKQAATGLIWKLVQIERNYQWYRDGSGWRYEPVTNTKQVANGKLDLTADGGEIGVPVAWGRYRLEIESAAAEGPASSVEFDAGWFVTATSTETPDGLEVALDKESYKVGDTAKLRVSSRFAGEALVNVGTESLVTSLTATIGKDGGEIDIPVTAEMGAGAYVTATLFRPGDDRESRMPMRAIGVKWLAVDPGDRKLAMTLDAPEKTLPRQPLDISVTVQGAGVGEEAYVTVAAVDVGILNLTGYEPPNPEDWYFGQRRLGVEIRDLYGRLIDGSLGATGRLRTGGDGAETALQGKPPTEKLVAFFAGPVTLDAEGKAKVSFDIPQFNGTARVMAVAWTKSGLGHASRDVIIRDPVVVTAAMPKFLAPGDQAELRLDIANTDAPAGDYTLDVNGGALVSVLSKADKAPITLAAGGKADVTLPITGGEPGTGQIEIALSGPNGERFTQSLDVTVRPSTPPMTERRMVRIESGRQLLVDDQLLANSIMQGASVSVNLTRNPTFDIASLLMTLDRYPYGCAEQTTSRALPLLYLSELSSAAGIADDGEVKKRVQDAIQRVLSYQSSSGSFGLWSPGSGDFWLDSYVTDFLTRAREQKFDVPEQALATALDNLENQLAYDTNVADRGNEMAYALYVLARNRKAAISDLRYYADTMLDQFPTQLAKAHIAAALALYGDHQRSERIFAEVANLSAGLTTVNWARSDYGSNLRDSAAILALAAESRPQSVIVPAMTDLVGREWGQTRYTSTQEESWMVLAARALKEQDQSIRVSVNGALKTGGWRDRLTGDALTAEPITLRNEANEPVTAMITTVASPKEPLPAGGEGFEISRAYYTLDGEEANPSEVKQNERYVVVLTVKQANDWTSRIMVSDMLPAGFEIDNPGLVNSASLSNFDWLPETQAAHLEFRYDRFLAALDHAPGDSNEFTLAYVVRATNPGVYDHPAATVEDMYRPQLSARTAAGRMQVAKD